jgi:hypothetical protein
VQAADVSPLRLSLIVDNVRTPDNLGAVIRVAAAAGARQVLLTKGCVEAWSPKLVRAAAGAHFQVRYLHKVFFFSIKQCSGSGSAWIRIVLVTWIWNVSESVNCYGNFLGHKHHWIRIRSKFIKFNVKTKENNLN